MLENQEIRKNKTNPAVLLFSFISWTGVVIRLLHDAGRTGSWLWLMLIPVVGWIQLLFALNERSEPKENL